MSTPNKNEKIVFLKIIFTMNLIIFLGVGDDKTQN